MKDKIIIGLTGNIATGKSTVMEMLAERGALTIDADQLVHQIIDSDQAVQEQIVARFGGAIQNLDGSIDRSKLGMIVFPSPAAMQDLEAIIHPHVGEEIDKRITETKSEVVVVEAIKLLEGKLKDRCQSIWVANCRPEQQIERLERLRELNRHDALIRVLGQAPQEFKLRQADVIIDTSGTFRATKEQVATELDALLALLSEPKAPAVIPQVDEEFEIRRAGPQDVDAMTVFINQAQSNEPEIDHVQLLQSFGEQGYMLAKAQDEIRAVIGWNTEDFIGRVREVFLEPSDEGSAAGFQLLETVCQAAHELMCEVALLFYPPDISDQEKQIFQACNFEPTELDELISAWRKSAEQSMPEGSLVMVRKLREERVMRPI